MPYDGAEPIQVGKDAESANMKKDRLRQSCLELALRIIQRYFCDFFLFIS